MNKAELTNVVNRAKSALTEVPKAIVEMTKDKPFELFKKENPPEDLYDLPVGYNVNKYSEYDQGAIMKVQGNDVTLFFTGDLYGQTWETELNQISFDNQVQLLSIINESL